MHLQQQKNPEKRQNTEEYGLFIFNGALQIVPDDEIWTLYNKGKHLCPYILS